MSVRASNAVWQHSNAKGNERLLALALADIADDDGFVCYQDYDQPELAEKINTVDRVVRRCVGALEDLGELIVARRAGVTNHYQLCGLPGLPRPTEAAKMMRANLAKLGQDPDAWTITTPDESSGVTEEESSGVSETTQDSTVRGTPHDVSGVTPADMSGDPGLSSPGSSIEAPETTTSTSGPSRSLRSRENARATDADVVDLDEETIAARQLIEPLLEAVAEHHGHADPPTKGDIAAAITLRATHGAEVVLRAIRWVYGDSERGEWWRQHVTSMRKLKAHWDVMSRQAAVEREKRGTAREDLLDLADRLEEAGR